MEKYEVIQRIKECGLVAVVRCENEQEAIKITEACIKGGVAAIEITFTVPNAEKIIYKLSQKYSKEEIILGAGTVLDPETARIAILNGAQYIVSPHLNIETVKLCNRYKVASMPGVMSIKETVEALEAGADILKVFPATLFGPKAVKAIKGPLPQADLMPTGGVSKDNVGEWIKAGSCAVGAGSALTKGAKTKDYDLITQTAKEFLENIKKARKENE